MVVFHIWSRLDTVSQLPNVATAFIIELSNFIDAEGLDCKDCGPFHVAECGPVLLCGFNVEYETDGFCIELLFGETSGESRFESGTSPVRIGSGCYYIVLFAGINLDVVFSLRRPGFKSGAGQTRT
jgi:hypothetical protein